jgi:hypothetical protein
MKIDLSTLQAKLIAAALLLGVFGLGYWVSPTKTVTKIEIKEVIKEVTKTEKTSDKVEQKNKIVIITETTHPDGTKTKETRITDKGTTTQNTTEETKKEIEKYKEQLAEKTTERSGSGVFLGAMAYSNINKFNSPEYGVIATKRVFGAVTAGAFYLQNRTTGLTLGVSF